MLLNINNITLGDWEKDSIRWIRKYYYSNTMYFEPPPVCLMLSDIIQDGYLMRIWYPQFNGKFSYLQEIYDKMPYKYFSESKAAAATNHIDLFLIKIDKIKSFI